MPKKATGTTKAKAPTGGAPKKKPAASAGGAATSAKPAPKPKAAGAKAAPAPAPKKEQKVTAKRAPEIKAPDKKAPTKTAPEKKPPPEKKIIGKDQGPSAKPPAEKKAAAPAPAGKTKKAPAGPAPAPAKGSSRQVGSAKPAKGKAESAPPPGPSTPEQRYGVMSQDAMAASRAAAARLAAAAGLHPVKDTSNGDQSQKNYTRITKSPFGKKELAEFREILMAKRAQLMGDVTSMESEALSGGSGSLSHMPQHMADQGTDTFDQALALDLAASQRGLLKEIEDALVRINSGTYGICEELGKPISVERLRHTPWARYCIEAARQHERASWFK